MSDSCSEKIVSSQTAPHNNLEKTVRRYMSSHFQDTIPQYAQDAFEQANRFVERSQRDVILDNGCGTGESTYHLAKLFPDQTVIGIDKSGDRLGRSHSHGKPPENLLFLHCDCIPFWQLTKSANWEIKHQYFFYPNPWPKPGHLQRRWHAHPVFPVIMSLGKVITMRTNWKIYAQEFQMALNIHGVDRISLQELTIENAMTPFERKYSQSGHQLFEVSAGMHEEKLHQG